ncbi:hypothetical protein F5X96DRAFT_673054 [Biscogniauxia mediterranea]|nr:hypothetical protein F5X96DRAFT_673054 [Biscogniauxia mediterranea]
MASTITEGPDDGTYGICGIPAPDVESKTKIIPYAPENFKAMPMDKKLSYFQIAGIRGFLATPWDGAHPLSDLCLDDDRFYHSNPLWRFENPEKGPDGW